MKKTCNNPDDHLTPNEIFDSFDEFDDEFDDEFSEIDEQTPFFEHEIKQVHRHHRKNQRRAKRQQVMLATAISKHKSPYRWFPEFHVKHADTSPKKLKNRFDESFGKSALKEFIAE